MSAPKLDRGGSWQAIDTSGPHPLPSALLAQALGTLVAASMVWMIFPALLGHPLALALLQGFCAMLVAWGRHAPVWWRIIHLIFMPLVILARGLELPAWFWFGGFVLLLLVFWRTDTSRVPLYLTNRQSGKALLTLLPSEACRVVDLGCGDGGLLRYLARARPDCLFVGIEHAPLTWAWAWLCARGCSNLSIRRQSIWAHSLAGYKLVYAFLSPAPMDRLWAKVKEEMAPDARLVSNSFPVSGQKPLSVIDVQDRRRTRLFVYANTGPDSK